MGKVCCWFSRLLREVFLRVLQFTHLLNNQHFQISVRSGLVDEEALCGCASSKSLFTLFINFVYLRIYVRYVSFKRLKVSY